MLLYKKIGSLKDANPRQVTQSFFLLFPADIERYLFDKYSELWIKYSQMSINFKQQKNRKH